MFKTSNAESEWDIFQNVIAPNSVPFFGTRFYTKSKKEYDLFEKITSTSWKDNTAVRPDFISDKIMIEMFEVDDIVTKKKGTNNPQRKADARALRTVTNFIDQAPEGLFAEDMKIIAHGDTRYDPELDTTTPENSYDHHNYKAYLNNFNRICHKHLDSVKAYRDNYPLKKLGFLIIDDSTFYIRRRVNNKISSKSAFYSFPVFDKNFMQIFIQSDVDFVLWAFNNKGFYTLDEPHGENSDFPNLFLINKEHYYNKHSRRFNINIMDSLEK